MHTAQQYEIEHLACPLRTDLVNSTIISVPHIEFIWLVHLIVFSDTPPTPKKNIYITLWLLIQLIRACDYSAGLQATLNCQTPIWMFFHKEHAVFPQRDILLVGVYQSR